MSMLATVRSFARTSRTTVKYGPVTFHLDGVLPAEPSKENILSQIRTQTAPIRVSAVEIIEGNRVKTTLEVEPRVLANALREYSLSSR